MAVTPYEEKKYVQSDAVTQAQQALTQQQANKPGDYQSQYQSGLDDLMSQIQNRDKFQYDVNADALYQQVAQNYLQQGKQAMMDTVGQAAALTGGYGNSYAQTAGQQQYNQHLLSLAELVPQYQQMALEQYQMEGDDLLNRYNLMLQQDENAYSRYQDALNWYYSDLDRKQAAYEDERDYDYDRFVDDRDFGYGKYQDELEYQYQLDRDAIEDEQWQKEYEETIRQFDEELAETMRQFDEELAWDKTQYYDSSSSSGSSGGSSYYSNDNDDKSDTAKTYNQVKADYIDYANSGATTEEKNELLNTAVNSGYITSGEADKIASIYKTPTKKYTAVDQMWDRHS